MQHSGRPRDIVSSYPTDPHLPALTPPGFNVGCYTLSVAGQVLHYRTWLFHNVKTHKILSRTMNLSGILQIIFGILCVVGVFAKCTPVQGNWDPTAEAKCWDEKVFLGINYTSSAITFVAYMIQGWIPIQMALSLGRNNITRSQWIALSAIAFWNVIAGVLALVKLSYLRLYVVNEDASEYNFPDPQPRCLTLISYQPGVASSSSKSACKIHRDSCACCLLTIRSAENGASGIVPSAAEMWAMLQQMVNRSSSTVLSRSGNTRTAISSHNKSDRPPSSSSEVELTLNKAGLGGITKTVEWETNNNGQQELWSNVGDRDNRPSSDFRSTNMASARSSSGH